METFALWSGFIGSWLLVTGSLFQAAIELNEVGRAPGHDAASRERLLALAPAPPPVSPWWWLLPPVGYALTAARTRRYREAIMARMDPAELRGMVRFGQKATGWLLVATGGFAIAVKETTELVESLHLGVGGLVVVILILAAVASSYTVVRLRRFEQYLARAADDPDAPALERSTA